MLKIEDVKVGDELVCIDRDGLLNRLKDQNLFDEIIRNDGVIVVSSVDCVLGFINYCDNFRYIHASLLKYFKNKEQSQYTFDDLIDVAVQAVKDGLIACDDFKRHSISFCVAWDEDDGYELASHHDAKYFDEAVRFIQSLYKETFVIESNGDMNRLKVGDRFSQNGSSVIIDKPLLDLLLNTPLFLTKGATVEQSRND